MVRRCPSIDKVDKRRFLAYVRANNGKKFFCYTNRKSSEAFVEKHILPEMPPDVEIFYITEKYDKLDGPSKFVSRIIRKMADQKKGFPCVARFKSGELVIKSVNDEVYRAIVGNADPTSISQQITQFFGE